MISPRRDHDRYPIGDPAADLPRVCRTPKSDSRPVPWWLEVALAVAALGIVLLLALCAGRSGE